jgi:hypothetical protein
LDVSSFLKALLKNLCCRRSSRMVVVVAVLNLIVLHILTLVCPAGVCCSCSRRLGPPHADALLLGACWPHPWMLWHMMVLLCGRMLCRRCRLGPLACRCFAAVSVLAPSADALPRQWSLCLGRVLLPVFRPLSYRCLAAVSVSAPSVDALPRRWSSCLGGSFAAWSF